MSSIATRWASTSSSRRAQGHRRRRAGHPGFAQPSVPRLAAHHWDTTSARPGSSSSYHGTWRPWSSSISQGHRRRRAGHPGFAQPSVPRLAAHHWDTTSARHDPICIRVVLAPDGAAGAAVASRAGVSSGELAGLERAGRGDSARRVVGGSVDDPICIRVVLAPDGAAGAAVASRAGVSSGELAGRRPGLSSAERTGGGISSAVCAGTEFGGRLVCGGPGRGCRRGISGHRVAVFRDAQAYQALSAQAAAFHQQFVRALSSAAGSYAAAATMPAQSDRA